jgi:DNA modification methylase
MTEIVNVKISKLKLLEKNPRKIDKIQFEKLCKSLQDDPAFLNNRPVLVNEQDGKLEVYAGNQRVRAAKKLGWKEVPCIVEKNLSDEIVKARTIKDNKTYGEFDFDILANDFEMEMLFDAGFTASDFDLNEKSVEQIEGECEEDGEVLEPGKDEDAVTQPGDLFELGDHRLVCGDSTMPDDVHKCLNGDEPILMVTDPPYGEGLGHDHKNWKKGKINKNNDYGIDAKIENHQISDWRITYSLFPGSTAYIWHSDKKTFIVSGNLIDCDFEIINCLIWIKPNHVLSRGDYHYKHEPCLYAVKKGCKHNWQGSRKEFTTWDIAAGGGFSKLKEDDEKTSHGTQKPLECMARPIRNNSAKGEGVYDPFLGSGTTLIASEMLGRKCYGLEISPAYCDIIVNRWIKYRQKNNLSTEFKKNGDTFTELSK